MCEDLNVISIIYYLKNIVDIIYIIVPILLILMLAVDLGKLILSGDVDGEMKKTISRIWKRTIATASIFFVPFVVFFIIGLIEAKGVEGGVACWDVANAEVIARLKAARDLENEIKKAEAADQNSNIQDSNGEIDNDDENDDVDDEIVNMGVPVSTNFTPFVNGEQRPLRKGECMNKSDNCFCPTVGKKQGFQFTMESYDGRKFSWSSMIDDAVYVTVPCDGGVLKKKVHKNVATNFKNALEKICELKTKGINGVKIDSKNLFVDGTIVSRLNSSRTVCSQHAYGYAIDINYNTKITVNGVVYEPWAGQGKRTKDEYERFINAIGSVNDSRNVNYILWKYAFEPYGFTWGGNWSTNSFDPMHYEVR